MDKIKSYIINGDNYIRSGNKNFDILQTYDKKIKMKVTLMFPKKQDESLDNG